MGRMAQLFHAVPKQALDKVLRDGLKAQSAYDDLGLDMRAGVVYCWLRQEDDKMGAGDQRPDYVYVEVIVAEDRCVVAEMDLISLAIMYYKGLGGRPVSREAAKLLAEAYRITSVPLSNYVPNMFSTPEVLVRGDISPDAIRHADAT